MSHSDYERVARIIEYLDRHGAEQPTLADLAAYAGVSEYHLQRTFRRWAGISPKRFLQFLTAERARQLLDADRPVLDVTYDVGLSSTSRLHDLFVKLHAVTPAEYRRRGAQVPIRYGFHDSVFGECLVAATDRGVCWLSFGSPANRNDELAQLRKLWSGAPLLADPDHAVNLCERIFAHHDGSPGIALDVKGTNFQIKVWEALLRIPVGNVASYEDVAVGIGRPGAARAVGNAVGANPVSFLIPCHRVIRATGVIGNYRWGAVRKRVMLGWEAAGADRHRAVA